MESRVGHVRALVLGAGLRRRAPCSRWILLLLGALPSLTALRAQDAFKRGDGNCDGCVNLCDVEFIAAFSFLTGPPPCCFDAADVNDNGVVAGDIGDVISLLGFLTAGGPAPPAPGPFVCGLDPTEGDGVDCAGYAAAGVCGAACPAEDPCGPFRRGDANCDACVDEADATFIADFLFGPGDPPCCMDAADANNDGDVTAADTAFLLAFLIGGPPPPDPGPETCGLDVMTPDDLDCAGYGAKLCAAECPPPVFKRGDANCDGCVNFCDAEIVAGYPFLGGPTPCCIDALDVNDDGALNATDVARLSLFLLGSAAPPPDPGPLVCGVDPTPEDSFDCASYPAVCDLACPAEDPCLFKRGDADCDGCVSDADATYIEEFLFKKGDPPCCMDAADANNDGEVTMSDATFILAFVSAGGPEPDFPGPESCGPDVGATPDLLSCAGYTSAACAAECPPPGPVFKRGDADGDGCVTACDAVFIANFNFRGGPAPPCMDAADANDNGKVAGEISDTAYLLAFLFAGGPAPPAPGPMVCGVDPTPDGIGAGGELGCASYPAPLCEAVCPEIPECYFSFLRGDCDGDGFVGGSVNDPIFYLNWAFGSGPDPSCLAACDADGDHFVGGSVNDAIYYLNWAFSGGPPPDFPYPVCAVLTDINDLLPGCDLPTCEG